MNPAYPPCPVCGATERGTPLHAVNGWAVYKCSSCGLGILDPCPTQEELEALYKEAYFTGHYDAGMKPGTDAMRKRLSQEQHRIKFFQPLKKTGRVLDIGCGRGYFLLACREQGYDVQGYDISEEGAVYVRDVLGIPVQTGSLQAAFGGAAFDVITMWHSLEHMPDPGQYLRAAVRWLRPDGVLVVDVPDHTGTDARLEGSSWKHWDLPYHLLHFTPQALDRMLVKYGFCVVRRKRYHSDAVKNKLHKIPLLGLFARPIAKLFSGSSYAVVAKKAAR